MKPGAVVAQVAETQEGPADVLQLTVEETEPSGEIAGLHEAIPATKPDQPPEEAVWLNASALLSLLGCEAVHLIGHSMGGAVAQLLLDRLPSPPRSVVSVEGNLIDDDCRFGSRGIAAVSIDEFLASGFKAFRASIDPTASAGYARYVDWVSRVSPAALHRSAISLVEWSDCGRLLDSFLTMPVPAAYIYGAENDQAEVVPLLQSATVIRVPDAGHFVMNDNPGIFYRVLAECLQSVGSRTV